MDPILPSLHSSAWFLSLTYLSQPLVYFIEHCHFLTAARQGTEQQQITNHKTVAVYINGNGIIQEGGGAVAHRPQPTAAAARCLRTLLLPTTVVASSELSGSQ
jgi:hypothetical protein